MKIWILQTGEPIHIDKAGLRPMRAMNLSNALVKSGHEVVIWSSNFDHFSKTHRSNTKNDFEVSKALRIKLIESRGYNSNIGLARLIDHAQLALNLRKMLRKEAPPDVAFIGYPPIETAWILTKWLKHKQIPILLDIKDAWPEVLLRVVPSKIKFLGRILLFPYTLMMKKIFNDVYGICAPTDEFLNWGLNNGNRSKSLFDTIAPLTSPNSNFIIDEITSAGEWLDSLGIKNDKMARVSFIGSLNTAFDFRPVIFAARNLSCQFVIAGDGPMYKEIKKMSSGIHNIVMPGWLSECQSKVLSDRSKIMLAPLKDLPDFKMSIPNKFFDYMSNGKPIFSSISGLAGKLISDNNIGREYTNYDLNSLTDLLRDTLDDNVLIEEMSLKSKQLFLKNFSSDTVYGNLVDHLVMINDAY